MTTQSMFANLPTTSYKPRAGYLGGKWSPASLEDVRDTLRAQDEQRNPTDLVSAIDRNHVDWTGDILTLQTVGSVGPDGLRPFGPSATVTKHALHQMAKEVLTPRGVDLLYALHGTSLTGRKLASMVWSTLATATGDKAKVLQMVDRLAADGVDPSTELVLRGVVSPAYTEFRDIHVVEAMLENLGNRPVLEWTRTHQSFRVRARIDDDWSAPELRKPIPIIEGWNGEVGTRGPSVQGGQWTLFCTNGMSRYDEERNRRFRHLGNVDGLRAKVAGAVQDEVIRAKGVIEVYTKARDVAVDDLYDLMRRELVRPGVLSMTQERVERSVLMLTHESIPSPDFTLSRAADAITYAAQEEEDPTEQERMEQAAVRFLERGLSKARDGRVVARA